MQSSVSLAEPIVVARPSLRGRLAEWLPQVILLPSLLATFLYVFVFSAWTLYVSLSDSTLLPSYNFVGFGHYAALWSNHRWAIAYTNLFFFGALYVIGAMAVGLLLAILIDQRVRGEAIWRTIYLYPLAVSFVVTGTVWSWLYNPTSGFEALFHGLGWTSFKFDWVVNPKMMIYCVAIAGIWQTSGFVMAMFLAGLRGIDGEILKAAQIDGASTFATYRRVVLPIMRPVFFSALIVLAHMAIKSYDLVLSVTGKNPGGAAELPSTFMYSYTFTRNQMAIGSTSAVIMLMTIAAIMVPYIFTELRDRQR